MIYAILKEKEKENAYLFDSWEEYIEMTLNLSIEQKCIIELANLSGKTYTEKQECLRTKAIEYSNNLESGLDLYELNQIAEYFERYGRRYGLLREFQENCIC